ncbi:hypothetical protein AAMO2058_000483500 [Amorphochlora amoebiformis]
MARGHLRPSLAVAWAIGLTIIAVLPPTRNRNMGSGVQNAKQHEMKQLSVQADRAIRFCLDRYDRWKSLHCEFNDQISDISKATNTTELRRLAREKKRKMLQRQQRALANREKMRNSEFAQWFSTQSAKHAKPKDKFDYDNLPDLSSFGTTTSSEGDVGDIVEISEEKDEREGILETRGLFVKGGGMAAEELRIQKRRDDMLAPGEVVETMHYIQNPKEFPIPTGSLAVVKKTLNHGHDVMITLTRSNSTLKLKRHSLRRLHPLYTCPFGPCAVRRTLTSREARNYSAGIEFPQAPDTYQKAILREINQLPVTSRLPEKVKLTTLVEVETIGGLRVSLNASLLRVFNGSVQSFYSKDWGIFEEIGCERIGGLEKIGDFYNWRSNSLKSPGDALRELELPLQPEEKQEGTLFAEYMGSSFIKEAAKDFQKKFGIDPANYISRIIIAGAPKSIAGINGVYRAIPGVLVNGAPAYEKQPPGFPSCIWATRTLPDAQSGLDQVLTWIVGVRKCLGLSNKGILAFKQKGSLFSRRNWYRVLPKFDLDSPTQDTQFPSIPNANSSLIHNLTFKYGEFAAAEYADAAELADELPGFQEEKNIVAFSHTEPKKEYIETLKKTQPQLFKEYKPGEFAEIETVKGWVPVEVTRVLETVREPLHTHQRVDVKIASNALTIKTKLAQAHLHSLPSSLLRPPRVSPPPPLLNPSRGLTHPLVLTKSRDSRRFPGESRRSGKSPGESRDSSPITGLGDGLESGGRVRVGFEIEGGKGEVERFNGLYARVEGRIVNGQSYYTKIPPSHGLRLWHNPSVIVENGEILSNEIASGEKRPQEVWYLGTEKQVGSRQGIAYLPGTPGVEDSWFSRTNGNLLSDLTARDVIITEEVWEEALRTTRTSEREANGIPSPSSFNFTQKDEYTRHPFGPGGGGISTELYQLRCDAFGHAGLWLPLYSCTQRAQARELGRKIFGDSDGYLPDVKENGTGLAGYYDVVIADTARARKAGLAGRSLICTPGFWVRRAGEKHITDVGDHVEIFGLRPDGPNAHLNGKSARVLDIDEPLASTDPSDLARARARVELDDKNLGIKGVRRKNLKLLETNSRTAARPFNQAAPEGSSEHDDQGIEPDSLYRMFIADRSAFALPLPRTPTGVERTPRRRSRAPKGREPMPGKYQIAAALIFPRFPALTHETTWVDLENVVRNPDGSYNCTLAKFFPGSVRLPTVSGNHLRKKPDGDHEALDELYQSTWKQAATCLKENRSLPIADIRAVKSLISQLGGDVDADAVHLPSARTATPHVDLDDVKVEKHVSEADWKIQRIEEHVQGMISRGILNAEEDINQGVRSQLYALGEVDALYVLSRSPDGFRDNVLG